METPKFVDAKNNGIFVLLVGDSSTGKTYISQTFPGPLYFLDTESRAINTKLEYFKDKEINIYDPIEFNINAGKANDAFDTHTTIENCTRFMIWFANEVKEGKIKNRTLIIDSVSDVWTWVQEWMILELAKYANKDGSKKADVMLMRVQLHYDWRIANKRHTEIVGMTRRLLPFGINVVVTAREEQVPQYVLEKQGAQEVSLKDKIRCHKDVPFMADVIIRLKKIESNGVIRYAAKFEKLGVKPISGLITYDLNYDKIIEALKK